MPNASSQKQGLVEFFASRFLLRENSLWRVMKLLGPVKHWVILANVLLAIGSALMAVGFVSLLPLAQATLSMQDSSAPAAVVEEAAPPAADEELDWDDRLAERIKSIPIVTSTLESIEAGRQQLHRWMQESLTRFVALYAVFLVCVVILQGLFQFLGNLILARATIRVTNDLMRDVYANVLRQEMNFFHNTSSGYLLNICYREIFQLRQIMKFLSSDRLMLPVQMAIFFVALFVISFKLSLLLLVLLPVVILPMMLLNRYVKQSLGREIEEEALTMEIMSEGLHNIQAVKAFGAESAEMDFIKPSMDQYVQITRRRRAAEAITGPIVDVLNMIVILSIFVAAIFVFSDALSDDPGQLLVFMVMLQRFYRPFRSLMAMKIRMQRAAAVANRIFRLLDREAQIGDAEDAVEFPAAWKSLRFRDVHLSYKISRKGKSHKRHALAGVNMEIRRGEAVALIGPNGAGKSSIVNLICRLYDPSKGHVLLDDTAVGKIRMASLHEKVCLITQHPILFNRSVSENIAYGLDGISQERITEAARASGADGFVRKLPQGYDTVIGEGGRNLSGGERQKIVLARAFVRQPEILILDEPTTGLDHETTREFLNLISALREKRGVTIIYITHERSHLARFDRVFRLTEEKTVVEEPMEALA